MSDSGDTDRVDIGEKFLVAFHDVCSQLANINKRLDSLYDNQKYLSDQIDILSSNVVLIHNSHKTFTERLSLYEQSCVDKPLKSSTPPPYPREIHNAK